MYVCVCVHSLLLLVHLGHFPDPHSPDCLQTPSWPLQFALPPCAYSTVPRDVSQKWARQLLTINHQLWFPRLTSIETPLTFSCTQECSPLPVTSLHVVQWKIHRLWNHGYTGSRTAITDRCWDLEQSTWLLHSSFASLEADSLVQGV